MSTVDPVLSCGTLEVITLGRPRMRRLLGWTHVTVPSEGNKKGFEHECSIHIYAHSELCQNALLYIYIYIYIYSHLRKFKTIQYVFDKTDKPVFIPNYIRLFQQKHNTTQCEI